MIKGLVSVIMPVFNAEKYLEKSISSVFDQTYKNVELICIDDNSSDNSYETCMNYAGVYKIKVLKNAINSGQEISRNRGLQIANGEYIMFLDADDYIEQNCIYKMYTSALRNRADITIATYSKVYNGIEKDRILSIESKCYTRKEFSSFLLSEVPFDVVSCIGSKLYNSSFLKNNNITFQNKYKYNEDMGFSLDSIKVASSIEFINKPFYKYNIRNSSSVMSSYRENMFWSIIKVWELMRDLFIQEEIFEQKKVTYYKNIGYLMANSLTNEVIFKDKKTFIRTATSLRDYSDFENALTSLNNELRYYFLFNLIKLKMYGVCYWILYFKKTKKRSEVIV